MKTFDSYLTTIQNLDQQAKLREILSWVQQTFPQLEAKIAWNQPMFLDHGTFIIGFSVSKQHISISPEKAGIEHFAKEFKKSGYSFSQMLFRIQNEQEVDYELLKTIIQFNCEDKKDCTSFWRK